MLVSFLHEYVGLVASILLCGQIQLFGLSSHCPLPAVNSFHLLPQCLPLLPKPDLNPTVSELSHYL